MVRVSNYHCVSQVIFRSLWIGVKEFIKLFFVIAVLLAFKLLILNFLETENRGKMFSAK